jgi:hypothetical protein
MELARDGIFLISRSNLKNKIGIGRVFDFVKIIKIIRNVLYSLIPNLIPCPKSIPYYWLSAKSKS